MKSLLKSVSIACWLTLLLCFAAESTYIPGYLFVGFTALLFDRWSNNWDNSDVR